MTIVIQTSNPSYSFSMTLQIHQQLQFGIIVLETIKSPTPSRY